MACLRSHPRQHTTGALRAAIIRTVHAENRKKTGRGCRFNPPKKGKMGGKKGGGRARIVRVRGGWGRFGVKKCRGKVGSRLRILHRKGQKNYCFLRLMFVITPMHDDEKQELNATANTRAHSTTTKRLKMIAIRWRGTVLSSQRPDGVHSLPPFAPRCCRAKRKLSNVKLNKGLLFAFYRRRLRTGALQLSESGGDTKHKRKQPENRNLT